MHKMQGYWTQHLNVLEVYFKLRKSKVLYLKWQYMVYHTKIFIKDL